MCAQLASGAGQVVRRGVELARVATITVSDSRGEIDDESGRLLRTELERAGFRLDAHRIVVDEEQAIASAVSTALVAGVDAVVLAGGTGIAPRDVTIEALENLFEKKIDGFGEAFRRLSWDEVGARAVLSRATAGVVRRAVVFALPGGVRAVRLGVEKLIVPMLEHAVAVARGETHLHGKK